MSQGSNKTVFDFSNHIDERSRDFTGRGWLFKQIDDWLADEKGSRYFIITGEPGSGKTAIASQLCHFSQGVPKAPALAHLTPNFLSAFHFCSVSDSSWNIPNNFAESLALQLAKRYPEYLEANGAKTIISISGEANVAHAEEGTTVGGVIIKALNISSESAEDTFDKGVRKPLETLLAKNVQKPIVILVDSLDEALSYNGKPTIVDLLTKCEDLPNGIRFILTSRPGIDALEQLKPDKLKECNLSVGDGLTHSREDVKQYILQELEKQPQLKQKLAKDLSEETFATAVQNKSDGNFLYVRFLLPMLAQQESEINQKSLKELPAGLDRLYREFISRLVGHDKDNVWGKEYKPIVGMLAVAQEPLSKEQLAKFTQMKSMDTVSRILAKDLRQLLKTDESLPYSKRTYTIYHSSFADFLLDEDRATSYYYCDVNAQHEHIINYYRQRVGGKSWEKVEWKEGNNIDKYGLLYLPRHLYTYAVGSEESKSELYTLLTGSPNWMKVKFRVLGSDAAYVDDLELAINGEDKNKTKDFSDPLDANQLLTLVKLYTARQVVHQRVSNYDNTDLKTLVWLGRKEEALSYARLRSDANDKFTGLMTIHYALQEKSQPDSNLLDEAREVAHKIETNWRRVGALTALAAALAQSKDDNNNTKASEVFTEAKAAAHQIDDNWHKAEALTALASALGRTEDNNNDAKASEVFTEAKAVAHQIDDNWHKERVLSTLAVALAQAKKCPEAEAVAREINDKWHKARALGGLAVALAQAKKCPEAEAVARKIKEERFLAEALIALAAALAQIEPEPTTRANQFFKGAAKAIDLIKDDRQWGEAMCTLTVALDQAGDTDRAKKVQQVIEDQIKNSWERAEALIKLATALYRAKCNVDVSAIFDKAREVALEIKAEWQKIRVLSELAAALAQAENAQARDVFIEARKGPHAIEKNLEWVEVVIKLSAVLAQAGYNQTKLAILLDKAEKVTDKIQCSWEQEEAQRKLKAARTQVGHPLEVSKVFTEAGGDTRPTEEYREHTEAQSKLTDNLAERQYSTEVFRTLRQRDRPSQFLAVLLNWVSAFKKVEQDLSIKLLREAICIFRWEDSEWPEI
ncbi:MAG: hypothetical protein Fur006_10270 [Coleofasciculaceae cyanobacterium]